MCSLMNIVAHNLRMGSKSKPKWRLNHHIDLLLALCHKFLWARGKLGGKKKIEEEERITELTASMFRNEGDQNGDF